MKLEAEPDSADTQVFSSFSVCDFPLGVWWQTSQGTGWKHPVDSCQGRVEKYLQKF